MPKRLLAFACSLFLLAACNDNNSSAAPSSNTTNNTATAPVVRVMVETTNEPFIIARTGRQMGGFEYELLQAIAQKQGLTLKFETADWQRVIKATETGEADIIASSITVTPERAQKMDFTNPHLQSEPTVLLAANSDNIARFADLDGQTIATKTGTTHTETAMRLWPKSQQNQEINNLTLVNSLIQGNAKAALNDLHTALYYAKRYENHNLRVLTDPSSPKEQLAFAVRKGNAELLKQLNDGLAAVKADGTYDRLVEQWFGENQASAPATASK